MRAEDDASYREFARTKAMSLRRLAYLLCADWHLAEDLTQTALIKMYRAWPKVQRKNTVDNYARQVLLRCWLDERRKPWRTVENRDGQVPDQPGADLDPALAGPATGTRDLLLRALTEIPPRQRAAVVLRYWADLSIADAAAALRCSEGTVKSQAARGLDALRAVVERLDVEYVPVAGRSV
ncbi:MULTISPECIES: RNA polymerase sigma factor [unclassified Crossiella]|uniref:RNA polymerase sigma factor n=1 Tax=unclassified Crossiella TaxID=2620835 RepID=UPI001FFFF9E4|nr:MULTISPECIES: SigE family RNA polymerase sigma factor [unclassified Crossiella]MCK2236487.1 SigE family RNA polymerase sigma factor [Crossiella sp. S99.2]MCK2250154.1 SigE family RNA polymerase sigma factor [Crossiella sp. S99.1]